MKELNDILDFCVTIKESAILPTNEQAQACLRVCQMLSNLLQDIHLFRFNPITGDVFILASENIGIIVPPDGDWEFVE